MTWQSRQSLMAEGLDACDRLQPAEEVSQTWRDGDRVKCPLPPEGHAACWLPMTTETRPTAYPSW